MEKAWATLAAVDCSTVMKQAGTCRVEGGGEGDISPTGPQRWEDQLQFLLRRSFAAATRPAACIASGLRPSSGALTAFPGRLLGRTGCMSILTGGALAAARAEAKEEAKLPPAEAEAEAAAGDGRRSAGVVWNCMKMRC